MQTKKGEKAKAFSQPGRKPGVFHSGRDAARRAAMDLIRGGPFAPSGSPAAHRSAHGAAVPGQTRKGENAKAFSQPGRKPGVFHSGRDAARRAAMDLIRGGPFAPSGSPAAHRSAHGAAVPGQTRKGENAKAFSQPGRKPGVFHSGRDAARRAAMDLIRGGPFAPSGSPAAHRSAHGAAVPGQTRKGEKAKAFSPYTGSGQIT